FLREPGLLEQRLRVLEELLAERGLDEPVQELVQAIGLDAAVERERIRALELLDAGELLADARTVRLGRLGGRLGFRVLEDDRRDRRHRRQVIGLMQLLDLRRERAAHDEPHDDLGALEAAARRVVRDRDLGELLGVVRQKLEELLVPRRVVEAAALAVHLVRETARADDRNLDVLRIAQDRLSQRLAELVAAARGRDRELQHADLERNDLARPIRLVRPQHGQRRHRTVVEAAVLEVRKIELVRRQALRDVPRERRMALDRRQRAGTAALVRYRIQIADAEREMRVVIEEERGDVIVVDEKEHVRALLLQPLLNGTVALENGLPDRIHLLVRVQREPDGRCMRRRDAAENLRHDALEYRK